MKWRVLRRSMKGTKAFLFGWQLIFSSCLVLLSLLVGLAQDPRVAGQLLAILVLLWTAGWIFGPVLYGVEDKVLKPAYFKTLPLNKNRFTISYALASFVGVAVPTVFLAFSAIVLFAARQESISALLVSTIVVFAQVALTVFGGRSIALKLRKRSRTQFSALLSSLITGVGLAFFSTGWWALGSVDSLVNYGVTPLVSTIVYVLPTGWGVAAVNAVLSQDWLAAVAILAALLAAAAFSYMYWSKQVLAQLQKPDAQTARFGKITPHARWSSSPLLAVIRREFIVWRRDYTRAGFVYFSVFYSLALCLYPATVGVWFLLPFASILFVVSVAASTSNTYAADGTGFWQLLTTPKAFKADVVGRQIGWLAVMVPIAIVITIGSLLASNMLALWPSILGIVIMALGIGASVSVLASSIYIVPLPDPNKRDMNAADNGIDMGQYMLTLLFISMLLAPIVALFIYVLTTSNYSLQWLVLLLGTTGGMLIFTFSTYLTIRQTRRHGSLILQQIVSGETGAVGEYAVTFQKPAAKSTLSSGKKLYYYMLTLLGTLLIFPQGVVPGIFKLTGNEATKIWFAALYMPQEWQWIVIIGAITTGITLSIYAAKKLKS